MTEAIIQRHQSRLIEKIGVRNRAQEIVVYSMVGTPLVNSSKYIVPVMISPKKPLIRVIIGDKEFEGNLIKGNPSDGSIVTIEVNSESSNSDDPNIMSFKKFDYIEYLNNPKTQTVRADHLFTDETVDTTFSYITSDLHWDPIVYHFIRHNLVESVVMGKITSKLPFPLEGATLIADSYPSHYPQGVQMRAMSSESSTGANGIEGNWISYMVESTIEEGTTIVPLTHKSASNGLNEPIPTKFSFHHLLTLDTGITRAEKEISFLCPFEMPSGEHVFVTQKGLTLQSVKEEYRKGQRLIQSLGHTAEVRANTNVSVQKTPNSPIEIIELKSEIDVDLKTIVSLRYFIGSRKYEIVKISGINDPKIFVNNEFLTFTKPMNPGRYKFEATIHLI